MCGDAVLEHRDALDAPAEGEARSRPRGRSPRRSRTRSGRPCRRRRARSSRSPLHTRQPAPPHRKQETSSSTLGSVNGKKCERSRISRSAPKSARAKCSQRALEVREREAAVDGEALDLHEHRRVRRVERVAAVDAARADHVDRRRLRLHHAHLHGRGLRAQADAGVDPERVRIAPSTDGRRAC